LAICIDIATSDRESYIFKEIDIATSDRESYIFKEAKKKHRRYPCSKVNSIFQAIIFPTTNAYLDQTHYMGQ
jgi:hypothetical protein